MPTTIESLSPCMYSSTHPTSPSWRVAYLGVGALKDALMLTIIEFLSPCMFSSTHSTSMSSRGAQHSIDGWFQAKLEAPQIE